MNPDKLENFVRSNQGEFDGEAPPAGLWDRIETAISSSDDESGDPLAEFIATNREAFDTETPPPKVFAGISAPRNLKVSHRRKFLGYMMGIAASLMLLFAAYNFGSQAGFRQGQEGQTAQVVEAIDPELAEAERFYQQRISSEFTKVSQVNDDPQLRRDLKEIDEATAQIRAELLQVPVSQRQVLVSQLIANYRTKLDILLRIQQHFPNPSSSGSHLPAKATSNES